MHFRMNPRTLGGLASLGQFDCGPRPELAFGEKAACCPRIGWVVFGAGESEYGICERAAALAAGEPEPAYTLGPSEPEPEPAGPLPPLAASRARWAEIRARRRALEERREEAEEERHEEELSRMRAQIAVKIQEAQIAERLGRIKAELEKELPEFAEKVKASPAAQFVLAGTAVLLAYMLWPF